MDRAAVDRFLVAHHNFLTQAPRPYSDDTLRDAVAKGLEAAARISPIAVEVLCPDGSWMRTENPEFCEALGHKTRTIYAVENKQ